jgi:rod shape-determining protein MreC
VAPPNRTARVAVLGSSVQRSRSSQYPSRGRSALVRRSVLGVLVVLALALLTISFRSPTSGPLHSVQGRGAAVLRPFQVAAERVARPFRDAYGYFSGLESAKSENARLRREVRLWRTRAAENLAGAQRAGAFAKLLKFEEGPAYPKDFRPVNTAVISFPSGPFSQEVAIAAGSGSGIRLNTPVVSPEGLVGRVTNVFGSTSVVTLLTDPDSAVAAVDLSSKGVRGLIQHGQGSTLLLDRVPKEQVVHKGDLIVTQGTVERRYPDLYPYGIPIGRVVSVGRSDIASYLTVQVAPFAHFGSLDTVAALVATKRAPKLP